MENRAESQARRGIRQVVSHAALELLDKKIAAPLEVLSMSTELDAAEIAWGKEAKDLALCNDKIAAANALIQTVKDGMAKKDKAFAARSRVGIIAVLLLVAIAVMVLFPFPKTPMIAGPESN